MGSYNSQYENYYSRMSVRKNRNNYSYKYGTKAKNRGIEYYITKRIVRELIGVLCLFSIVIVCKVIVTPQTVNFYNYSKKKVNENFNYVSVYNNIKNYKFSDMQYTLQKYFDSLRVNITEKKEGEENTKSNFSSPIDEGLLLK